MVYNSSTAVMNAKWKCILNLDIVMTNLLIIGLGGFLGAICRYLVSGWIQTISKMVTFPLGTLVVNSTGCFIIGILSYLSFTRSFFSPEARLFLIIGFLGAFTTFSSFSVETLNLVRDGEWVKGLLNVGLSNLICLAAVWLGFTVSNLLWR
jgi:CrcB protein